MKYPEKKRGGYHFPDYPNFRPNVAPWDVFKMGAFGGTYWRPIYSGVTGKKYRNVHHKDYPKTWWRGIPEEHLSRPWEFYDKNINQYRVRVGSTLDFWESKDWIKESHPYGWFQWYCDFFAGKRSPDDVRQIKRWESLAGPRGRFRKWLIRLVREKSGKYNDYTVSPSIRQTLLHWGYELIRRDYENDS